MATSLRILLKFRMTVGDRRHHSLLIGLYINSNQSFAMRCPYPEIDFLDFQDLCTVHGYYKSVRAWDLPLAVRSKILSELLSHLNPYNWRVIGCTKAALQVFAENNFKYRARLGINRGHKHKRADTMSALLQKEWSDPWQWFYFYFERDKTILMTAAENRRLDNKINPVEPNDIIELVDLDLFPDGNYCWRHGPKEVEWLRSQAENHLSG